ncbi:TEA domain-containing protein [Mycena indigotica]|uniref:TEA domain-containing protein n=1 Tax=Mycena indigotica TaxID=2126181 RepID=A0A8H6T208_9AGAR|nr:TEA domain-containing protein [Mycena indigotica]KAF7309405.1 TEA domain-containing protein [Mycena indigotica]
MPHGSAGASQEFLPEPTILGRRSYKIPRGETEPVWTSELEDALLKALDAYSPARGHHRAFQRNPKRNRFISDFIFNVTGTRRTAKQVGSRLQQMRDTCQNERIQRLIQGSVVTVDESVISFDSASSPSASSSDHDELKLAEVSPEKTYVTIQLQPLSERERRSSVTVCHGANADSIQVDCSADLASSIPLVTFTLPFKISLSHCSYYKVNVGDSLVYADISEITFLSSTRQGEYTYSTPLVPSYWTQLSCSSQLYECVVELDILQTRLRLEEHNIPSSPHSNDLPVRSFVFRFAASLPSSHTFSFTPPNLAAEPCLPPEFPGSRNRRPIPIIAPTRLGDNAHNLPLSSSRLQHRSEASHNSTTSRLPLGLSCPVEEQDISVLYTHDCDWSSHAAATAGPSDYAALATQTTPSATPPLLLHYSYDGQIIQHPTPSYPIPPTGNSLVSEWAALYAYEPTLPTTVDDNTFTVIPSLNAVVPYFYQNL